MAIFDSVWSDQKLRFRNPAFLRVFPKCAFYYRFDVLPSFLPSFLAE